MRIDIVSAPFVGTVTGNPQRLAALRAGETVDMQSRRRPGRADAGRLHAFRAVASPDGRLEFRAETAAEVLADLGL